MKVWVHMKDEAKPVPHIRVINTYVKGPFFCVMQEGPHWNQPKSDDIKPRVVKYPISNIWRVTEEE